MFLRRKGHQMINTQKLTVLFALLFALVFTSVSCSLSKGSIVIMEKPYGSCFDISLNTWSAKDTCRMSLNKGDEIQVEVVRGSGDVSLSIRGRDGGEVYSGNGLESGTFTVSVSSTGEYIVQINGHKATGRILLKKLP